MVAETAVAEYYSRFGGLWIDRLDALKDLADRAAKDRAVAQMADKLKFFIENGYVIFEKAVPEKAIDAYLSDFRRAHREGSPLVASVPVHGPGDKDVIPLRDADLSAPLTKVLDTYVYLKSAYPLMFTEPVQRFLRIVFEDDLLAFQGLHFEKGSTQSVHQDTAYVVVDEPLKLCASWVALEDIQPGSGELIYFRGSHRLPDWLYSGKFKHYNHERDKHEEHLAHLQALETRSKERGYLLETFRPKKGDALIWAADLAHGGSPISNLALTRRSLVTHFAPAHCTPNYFRYLPENRQVRHRHIPGCFSSTFYY